jgi:hypothetical protein
VIRRTGGAGEDVRVVMDGAHEHEPLFAELAGLLGRDVHISTANGAATRWRVIQPPTMRTRLPGWFDTTNGAVRSRTGLVSLPLPNGLLLATRADFVGRRAAAAGLLPGEPGLITIGALVRGGGFLVGDYTGAQRVADGRQLAAALSAVPLYGGEVRMWTHWPSDVDDRRRLNDALTALAASTGATVWAPQPDSVTEILDSCGDLGATDPGGEPSGWRSYSPPAARSPRFESDQDGRLAFAGAADVATYPGVPLVSVPPERMRVAHERYGRLRAQPGLFVTDLTILADGRWAVQHAGRTPQALGPRVLQRLLRTAGWHGEDLLLLSAHPGALAAALRRYGGRLVERLHCQVYVLPPGADFDVQDGSARAIDRSGRPATWQPLDRDRDAGERRWRIEDGRLLPADDKPLVVPRPMSGPQPVPLGPQEPSSPPQEPAPVAGPALTTARRRPLGIYWLADRPQVNAEPIELYVVAAGPFDRGIPTPHLFLVGALQPPDPQGLADDELVLTVQVARGGAVDLSSIHVHEPPEVQQLLGRREATFVLPGALLRHTQVLESHRVDGSGRLVFHESYPSRPALELRCSGAAHGVEGLPGDVPRWPWTAESTAYALLPNHRRDGAVVLLRRRPAVAPGRQLVHLRVPWRAAIDVRAAAKQLAALGSVRSTAERLLVGGVELLLPAAEYRRIHVLAVYEAGRFAWRGRPGSGPSWVQRPTRPGRAGG